MKTPDWRAGEPLVAGAYADLVQRAAFDCCKWTLASQDLPTLCRFPLLLGCRDWEEISRLAELLAAETVAAEKELLERQDLHGRLGVPAETRRRLKGTRFAPALRYVRFDFHPTPDGLRITEANCDVAGGWAESSGIAALFSRAVGLPVCGDPAGELARGFAKRLGRGSRIGFMHISRFAEDRQVVTYLARRMEEEGLLSSLFDARQLRPSMKMCGGDGVVDLAGIVRFFPAEWLQNLDGETGWSELFNSSAVCNPLSTVLTQSKRFPLAWAQLETPLANWRALLPETRAPQDAPAGDGWVLKPALGYEGDRVSLEGVTTASEMREVRREVKRDPGRWVAQKRFEFQPLATPDGPRHVCFGVYVVDGRACGAYARCSARPLIDERAQDLVVLLEDP